MVVAAETTRTLRAELSPDALGHFVVENLAGTMRVVPGSGPSVVAVATIHAEDDDLAKAMKVEQVAGKLGVPTLRVIYPLDRGNTIRYPGRGSDAGILGKLFGDFNSSMEYDGQRVKVSSNHGVLPVHCPVISRCQRCTADRIAACFICASFDASGNCLRAASSMYVAS